MTHSIQHTYVCDGCGRTKMLSGSAVSDDPAFKGWATVMLSYFHSTRDAGVMPYDKAYDFCGGCVAKLMPKDR